MSGKEKKDSSKGSGKLPKTQPRISSVLNAAGFTQEVVQTKVAEVLLMNRTETQEMKNDEFTSNFDLILIAVIEAAQRTADTGRLDNLLEKIFGKTVEIKGSVSVHNTNVDLPVQNADSELIKRAIERALKNNA